MKGILHLNCLEFCLVFELKIDSWCLQFMKIRKKLKGIFLGMGIFWKQMPLLFEWRKKTLQVVTFFHCVCQRGINYGYQLLRGMLSVVESKNDTVSLLPNDYNIFHWNKNIPTFYKEHRWKMGEVIQQFSLEQKYLGKINIEPG